MRNISLKQLRYFEALARHGHFGKAAEACAVSQPALSMQIKELEESFGAAVVERGSRRVQLTAFGAEAATRVGQILRSIDELGDLARSNGERLEGRLRIGVIPTIAPYLLPAVISRLKESHPGLEIYVRETVTPKLIQELEDGQLDTAILALPVSEPAFTEVPLFSESFVLVRPMADKESPLPSPDALRQMQLLLLEEGHCFRDQALSFCNLRDAKPREVLDASSLSTLVQMVASGLGVTLIPEMAVGVETRSAEVAIAAFASPKPERTVGMVWRKTSPLADKLQGIADVVREAAGNTNPG